MGTPGCGQEVDRAPAPAQTYYGNIEQWSLTFGNGVMRDAELTFDAVFESLRTPLQFCFVPDPERRARTKLGSVTDRKSQVNRFTAYGNSPDSSMIRQLLRDGGEGLISF